MQVKCLFIVLGIHYMVMFIELNCFRMTASKKIRQVLCAKWLGTL